MALGQTLPQTPEGLGGHRVLLSPSTAPRQAISLPALLRGAWQVGKTANAVGGGWGEGAAEGDSLFKWHEQH